MRAVVEKYLTYAGITFVAFAVVGAAVAHVPPSALDRSELGTYGVAVGLARFFTAAGRFPIYLALCIVALIFGIVRRAWFGRVLVSVIGLVVVWQTSDLLKLVFHRARPDNPILPETSFGYPSGHADLALFFYGLWASYVWESELGKPLRVAIVVAMLAWIVAIGWSRLALGAHYPSDVIGGYLLGVGCLAGVRAFIAARFRSKTAFAAERFEALATDK